ncbi:MAG: YafY family protein [Myxococcales bacterium]
MRRADRLFQLVQILRRRRVTTAAALADELEVSERTIYRSVQDLVRSGVPIQGEAGVGYALARNWALPPLTFARRELAALALGARIVQSWADPELAKDAASALRRIESALPDVLLGTLEATALFAPAFHVSAAGRQHLAELRRAIDERRKVRLTYRRGDGKRSTRTLRPLGLFFWGQGWSLAAWCELREGFRHFRLDRIGRCEVLAERFEVEPGRGLAELLAAVAQEQRDGAKAVGPSTPKKKKENGTP